MKKVFPLIVVIGFFVACTKPNNDDVPDEVIERVVSVATAIDPIFLECESAEEMIERIDEINDIEGVIETYSTETCVYVEIDGWGTIGYPFYDKEDNDVTNKIRFAAQLRQVSSGITVRSGDEENQQHVGTYSACIMNAQHQEQQWTREVVRATEEMFQKSGIPVTVNNNPTLSFFRNEIFDYDLVFIIGHGDYNSWKKLHWLETSETFEIIPDKDDRNNVYYNKPTVSYPKDEVMLYRSRKRRDGERGVVFQYYVSEQYITNSSKSFAEKGKAVLFMVPCQSLKGRSKVDRNRHINDSLAEAFFAKGAGLYIGYDESSCSNAQFGGMIFMGKLLSGESFKSALNDFPNSTYTFHEHRKKDGFDRNYDVAMHVLTSNDFQLDSFIISPGEVKEDHSSEDKYVFTSSASYSPEVSLETLDLYYNSETYEYIPYTEVVSFVKEDCPGYGFIIGKGTDPANGTCYSASVSRDPESHRVVFRLPLPCNSLDAHTEYHVWPYIAVNTSFNYGEPFVFMTGDVKEDLHYVIPEPIDLGLSVKWASFNLGASKPEEYGDYFAWGETKPYYTSLEPLIWKPEAKEGYDWRSYSLCMGSFESQIKYCTDSYIGYDGFVDGKTTLELKDDAAHENLGGDWRMPTNVELEELLNNCAAEEVSQNDIKGYMFTGPSGKSIFLPYSGFIINTDFVMNSREKSGTYWSSSLLGSHPDEAFYLYVHSRVKSVPSYQRYIGFSIRPVYGKK